MMAVSFRVLLGVFFFCLLLSPAKLEAGPEDEYSQAMALAAAGRDSEAVARLNAALNAFSDQNVWRARMLTAAGLLFMREQKQASPAFPMQTPQTRLASAYLQQHPAPEKDNTWLPGVFAVLFPGAGHAWLGRYKDAGIATVMVWPMLLLTFWAGKRRMGPVTVFFAMITVWLWSGTVFSAVSLAERSDYENYLVWWQGLWQASGLQGRPW